MIDIDLLYHTNFLKPSNHHFAVDFYLDGTLLKHIYTRYYSGITTQLACASSSCFFANGAFIVLRGAL